MEELGGISLLEEDLPLFKENDFSTIFLEDGFGYHTAQTALNDRISKRETTTPPKNDVGEHWALTLYVIRNLTNEG